MSLPSVRTINCPRCKRPFEVTVWDTVNVTIDPAFRDRVMKNTLRCGTCPHCKQQVQFDSDLIYHDMDRKFMIAYIHTEPGKAFTVPPLMMELGEKGLSRHQLRFVTSYNQLREKIVIFEAGLIDWAIEALKMILWVNSFPNKKITNDSVYFYSIKEDKSGDPKMVFCFFEDGKDLGQMQPSYSTYAACLANVGYEKMREYKLGEWQLVNQTNLGLDGFGSLIPPRRF